MCPLSDFSFELQQAGFLGGQVPKKQTVPRAELCGSIQVLSRLPIDAMYVTKGVTHRSELEQGPNEDLWSKLFQFIDEHTGNTNILDVKSHLDDAGPAAIKQKKIEVHANSLADVVAEAPENGP